MLDSHTDLHIFYVAQSLVSTTVPRFYSPTFVFLEVLWIIFMKDNATSHRKVVVSSLLESGDVQGNDSPAISQMNMYWTFLEDAWQHATSHQQRFLNFDTILLTIGLGRDPSTVHWQHRWFIDNIGDNISMDRRCRSCSALRGHHIHTKDWIFLVNYLWHTHFCLLFSCVRSDVFNKFPFVAFGFLFWKFWSLTHILTSCVPMVRFASIWSSSSRRYI